MERRYLRGARYLFNFFSFRDILSDVRRLRGGYLDSTTAVPGGASSFRVHSSCRLHYKEVRKEYTFQIIKPLIVHRSV